MTIDPLTAKDLDDALHIHRLANGNFECGVHIADVGHFLKAGSGEKWIICYCLSKWKKLSLCMTRCFFSAWQWSASTSNDCLSRRVLHSDVAASAQRYVVLVEPGRRSLLLQCRVGSHAASWNRHRMVWTYGDSFMFKDGIQRSAGANRC